MDFEQEFQKAQDFLKESSNKHVHIFHDSDADGIGAGLQLFHTLQRLGANPTRSTHANREDILSPQAYEQAAGAQRVIIADVNPKTFGTYQEFKDVFADTPTLILDHHHVEDYPEEIYVHAGELNGVEGADYCTAKLAYDVCTSVLTSAQDFAWLAAAGIIADMNYLLFPEVIQEALSQEGFDPQQDIFASELSVVNNSIQCSQAKGNASLQSYLQDLEQCESLADAVKLGNPHPEVIIEFNKFVALADRQVGKQPVIWIKLDTHLDISGWVSNAVSNKHKDEIIVVYRDTGDSYSMSLRNQSRKVHLGEIAQKCSQAVGGSGGGHMPAAGANVPKERFKEYQLCVEQEVHSLL